MKTYPTKFECTDGEELLFSVQAFDQYTATIKIESGMTLKLWREIATEIDACMVGLMLEEE